jgi:putative SOS response-associated peptidase YedK
MCGRFTLRTPPHLLAKQFQLDDVADLAPRYNIAPTQDVAVVRLNPSTEKRELSMLRWGLIPFWAEDPKIGYSTINARAETVATKPSFREAFKKRRCLVVADGFYEWQKTDGQKQPYLIHLKDNSPFAFAGLWERWRKGEQAIESCSSVVPSPTPC